MKKIVAILEARCWSVGGVVQGRQRAAALDELASACSLTVIARPTEPEVGGQRVVAADHNWMPIGGLRQTVRAAVEVGKADAVVVYLPGYVSVLFGLLAVLTRRRLVCIVVGDPTGALARDVVPGARGAVARLVIPAVMRFMLARATVARYVTQRHLQERYPAGPRATTFAITDAKPPVPVAQHQRTTRTGLRVLTVGSLDRPYKGVQDLVRALEECAPATPPLELLVVGSGRLKISQAESGANRRVTVTFLGQLTEVELTRVYADADVFALASWTEGLPRTLIEAMAAGLPCAATRVGGVSELLEDRFLAEPRNVKSMSQALLPLLESPHLRQAQEQRNRAFIGELLTTAEASLPAFVREVVRP